MSRYSPLPFLLLVYSVTSQGLLGGLLGGGGGNRGGGNGNNRGLLGLGGGGGLLGTGLLGSGGGGVNADASSTTAPGSNTGLVGGLLGTVGNTVNAVVKIPLALVGSLKKADVVEDMKGLQGGKAPSDAEWQMKAQKFCERFPNHPNCRGGQLPLFSQLTTLLGSVTGSVTNFLPQVPKLLIADPLAGIEKSLVTVLNDITMGLGAIGIGKADVLNICKSVNCKKQDEKTVQTKQLLSANVFDFEKKLVGEAAASKNVQLRFDRTQQIKEALLEKSNLSGIVVPADNGVFDLDQMLTEQQANFLLNELGKGGDGAAAAPPQDVMPEDFNDDGTPRTSRGRRASVFFEENPVKKWPTNAPVSFTFDSSIEQYERDQVRSGLQEIQQRTCIRFRELPAPPNGPHIIYYKVDSPSLCGLSYVGRTDPANPIYLTFGCENSRGVAIHETMHALGVAHQHLRMDRDQHITMNWQNIAPQQYDAFVVVDSKMYTTYGVKYDYGSIMHYHAYTAAINVAQPTMLPKVNFAQNVKLLGQRSGMSASDVEILNKMYCKPGCDDKNVYCGAWALKGVCTSPSNDRFMAANCRKSCNLC